MTNPHADLGTEAERLRSLLCGSPRLTDEAVALAQALGPDVCGRIVAELVETPSTRDARGSAIRAAHLARELGLDAAAAPLVRYVEGIGVRFPVGRTVLSVVARLGSAGAGALLGLRERCDAEDQPRITEALAHVDVRDEQVRAHLVRTLEVSPASAARALAERGEWRAVPDLLRALETLSRRPVADCAICAAEDLSAIGAAVVALGGELSEAHTALIDGAFEGSAPLWTVVDDDWVEAHLPGRSPALRAQRPGRNDPCPCGSGKKHKRCCLDADRGGRRH